MAPFLPGLGAAFALACAPACAGITMCRCHCELVPPCPGVTVSWCHRLAFPRESVSAGMCATGAVSSATTVRLSPWSLVITRSNSTPGLQDIYIFIEHSNQ